MEKIAKDFFFIGVNEFIANINSNLFYIFMCYHEIKIIIIIIITIVIFIIIIYIIIIIIIIIIVIIIITLSFFL